MEHIITKVNPHSIAEELQLEPGDKLLKINNQEIKDVFDYRYLINDEYIELTILKKNGEEWILEVEKDFDEDLGMEFENSLMSDYKSCTNKCVFCFIDQMPPGMRDTLYFKDDDSRLSFLQGNYITLTNMKKEDVERIIQFHLEPINISIQTMNPQLRCKMLHNRFADRALPYLEEFAEHGITMNGQIVLCKGLNDGKELKYSIEKIFELAPAMQSVSVVPSGLTKYRDGLYPLELFTKEDACEVIDLIESYQKIAYEKFGLHLIHASDEWYIMAERDFPEKERYDGYLQLENGVGMMRLLYEEVMEYLNEGNQKVDFTKRHVSIATGKLAAPMIEQLSKEVMKRYPGLTVKVYTIINNFFGTSITVSGLITATDLMDQLKEENLGDVLLLPSNMLRSGEDVFLDDIHLGEVETTLQIPINIVESSGKDLVNAMIGTGGIKTRKDLGFNYIEWRKDE